MPSPFPGMNPYLEQHGFWRGVHARLLADLQGAINHQILPRYIAELEESLYIDPTGDEPRLFAIADNAISDQREEPAENGTAVSATAVLVAPTTVTIPEVTKKKMRRLVIRDTKTLEVITVIELLSPSNKEFGTDRDKYIEKRVEILTSQTHLIELDLLRGGQRLPIRNLAPCDYYVLVSRSWERPRMGVWPVKLREALPTIPLPLRRGEPEPTINLKAVLDRSYDEGGFGYRIYSYLPEPPLAPADAEWAKAFIPASPL